MNEWINYEHYSPDCDGEYLVYIPWGGGHIVIADYDADLGGWLEYSDYEVTHWQHLPDPPNDARRSQEFC